MNSRIITLFLAGFSPIIFCANPLYKDLLENKRILITGGTGFIGKALTTEILKYDPLQIIIFSRDEVKHANMLQQYNDPRLKSVLGDVRDYRAVKKATREVDIVIHAAALKRLDTIEYNICESIKTNIEGTENIAHACFVNKVSKAIFISSDKACSPANAYGACKYVSEKIFTNYANGTGNTQFIVVRYGNVLESTGSVVPFFCEKIKNNKVIPLTDARMTRFFIAKEQATELIFKALLYGAGGEIFVPVLPAFKIVDLIAVLQEHFQKNLDVEVVGIRPGEKIHELMINSTEIPRTYKFHDMFLIVPTIKIDCQKTECGVQGVLLSDKEFTEYGSGTSVLPRKDLYDLLKRYGINVE